MKTSQNYIAYTYFDDYRYTATGITKHEAVRKLAAKIISCFNYPLEDWEAIDINKKMLSKKAYYDKLESGLIA